MLVLVYGTLKRGGSNHSWLGSAGFVGAATTLERYTLYAIQYPFMVREPAYPVHGEVYEVDADGLARLDVLEGHPDDYFREEIAVVLGNGRVVQAWAYLHAAPQGERLEKGVFDASRWSRVEFTRLLLREAGCGRSDHEARRRAG
ncbi:gamma-glutamylcyclotransferase family protein [Chitinibacteraceae bacterium HSL-7]